MSSASAVLGSNTKPSAWRPREAGGQRRGSVPCAWQPSGVEHRDYVQSFVNILPTSPETGGNVIVPLSHRVYKQLAEDFLDENGGINYSRVAK